MTDARRLLDALRGPLVTVIAEQLTSEGFLGVAGPPESGSSTTVRRAVAQLADETMHACVYLDLDGVYSDGDLARRWLHALLSAIAGPLAMSHLALEPELRPPPTRRALLEGRRLLGEFFDLAAGQEGDSSRAGEGPRSSDALALTIDLARDRGCTLIVDHPLAPELTSRHPVSAQELLWEIRSAADRSPLRVSVVTADHGRRQIAGAEEHAFFGDGHWVRVQPPTAREWSDILPAGLGAAAPEVHARARGHVPTTLALLDALGNGSETSVAAHFARLASTASPHARRCVLHAASLHRLAPHVLLALANGDGAYQATPDAASRDIATAVQRLATAELIQPGTTKRSWRLVDPFVEWNLAEGMNRQRDTYVESESR